MPGTGEIREALKSPKTFTTVLNAIILDKYKYQVYDWDPLTVYLELKADYEVEPIPEATDRISAAQVIMGTNAFFDRVDAFIATSNTLNTGDPYFAAFANINVEEMCWAISEVALMREMRPFSRAIKEYIKLNLKEGGYTQGNYPEAIQLALDPLVKSEAIRATINQNRDVAEQYVSEQMEDLVYQFEKIPTLSLDEFVIRDLEEDESEET